MGFIDSDDDFSGPSNTAKKSKLSRKKTNKENVSKPHTSTQLEQAEPVQGRSGRPLRKTPEELKFQLELDVALRMSSEEVSSSSGEVLPPVNIVKEVLATADKDKVKEVSPPANKVKEVAKEKLIAAEEVSENVVNVENILEVERDSQGSMENEAGHGASSAETVNLEETDKDIPKIVLKKKKLNIIESDDEFETEVARKVPQFKKIEDSLKKRKVEETWVVTKTKKSKSEKVTEPVGGRSRRKPAKKYLDSSASEDEFSDDSDKADNESDEEFSPSKSKEKLALKKSELAKMNPPAQQKTEPLKTETESVHPLRLHNSNSPAQTPPASRLTLSYSSPRPLNIDGSLAKATAKPRPTRSFQSPGPSKLMTRPATLTPGPSKPLTPVPTRPATLTPGPSTPGSISSLLSSLPRSLTKSTPLPAPSTRLASPKMPLWTPPSRAGRLDTNSPAPSPGIGLRVGLSRNWKASKPLHSGVKYPT